MTSPARAERFPMPVRGALRFMLLPWGVTPGRAYVDLYDDALEARFGFSRFRVPLSAIANHRVTGPYRLWRAIGIRMTPGHWDLSYGSTTRGGLCLTFRTPIRHFLVGHPALTVTVADPAALASALERRGVPSAHEPLT